VLEGRHKGVQGPDDRRGRVDGKHKSNGVSRGADEEGGTPLEDEACAANGVVPTDGVTCVGQGAILSEFWRWTKVGG
jgi:hypothetical protein